MLSKRKMPSTLRDQLVLQTMGTLRRHPRHENVWSSRKDAEKCDISISNRVVDSCSRLSNYCRYGRHKERRSADARGVVAGVIFTSQLQHYRDMGYLDRQ